ncbi:MAG TPA: threonine synthase, partial [Gemmatimonadales bacterium]|nr:threonine synthase [Gemmatimonadales bacterium]
MNAIDWMLECPACKATKAPEGLDSVCACGHPWLVRYPERDWSRLTPEAFGPERSMWRYRPFLPLTPAEAPISLGEGLTPLLRVPRSGERLGARQLYIKEEGTNPTGSFKARGLSAAITRAVLAGAERFTLPTAGNAGVAASAYGARAGKEVRVFAPQTTPPTLLAQIKLFGGDLHLDPGHIGDCGKRSRAWAAESGAMDLSTLREPYRIEGKKTLGLELAEQFGWTLPDVILYPTGGGTGLIGMWKAFQELRDAGWVRGKLPRMYSVQSTGCAPIIRAFEAGTPKAEPWADPWTVASGLRVPGPLGDRLILAALRESGGGAVAVADEALMAAAATHSRLEGLDLS